MKKVLYLIISILILYVSLEFSAFIILFIKCNPISFSDMFKIELFNTETYDDKYRTPIIINSKSNDNIIIFGDSFAYGDNLTNNQNFSGKLSKYTRRNVFNRAQGGTGPQMMLFQLTSNNFKNIVKNCNTVLYLYSCDPTNRVVKYRNHYFQQWASIRYKLNRDNSLKLQKISYIQAHSFIYSLIEQALPIILGEKYCNQLFFRIVETSYFESKKLYPNSTFYILVYDSDFLPFEDDFLKLGIKIIKFKKLTTENLNQLKYYISDSDPHPNEAVWELITPLLVDKI